MTVSVVVCTYNYDRFIIEAINDPPPLKWSNLRYVFDIKDCNGKEALQARRDRREAAIRAAKVLSRLVLEFGDAISGISRVPSQAARSIG